MMKFLRNTWIELANVGFVFYLAIARANITFRTKFLKSQKGSGRHLDVA